MLLFYYAYRSLLARARTNLISILSVTLFVAGGSLGLGYYLSLRSLLTKAPPENLIVIGKGASSEVDSKLPLETARKVVLLDGVKREHDQPLAVREQVSRVVLSTGSSTYEDPSTIRGIDEKSLRVHQVKVIAGTELKRGTLELMIGKRVAQNYPHMKLGYELPLPAGKARIVGIFSAGGGPFEDEVWTDRGALEIHLNAKASSSVTIVAESAERVRDIVDTINSSRELDAQADTVAQFRADRGGLDTVARVVLVLLILLSAVATFAIATTMNAAVAVRMPELAALAAIGIQRVVLGRIVLFESTLLGILGALLGVGGATLLANALGRITFGHNPVELSITWFVMAAGAALGLLVGLIGGLGPSVSVRRIDILRALR